MGEERDGGSFWDIGEPRKVLERIENGQRSCDDLMGMIQERADVELRYARSLRQWAAKWDDALRRGPEYGSVQTAWRTMLQEASAVAKIHEDCRLRLTGEEGPYFNVYKWKNDHFHCLGTDGLSETQQARQAFAAAQSEYAKLLSKLRRAKKAYYNASFAAYKARRFADEEASNPTVSPEASWKLREKADRLALERERLKQVYLRRVMVCNVTAKERYVESMTSVFNRWQGFERERLEFIQSQLQLFARDLNTHSRTGISQVYQRILSQVRRAEPAADVEEWGRKYGTGSKASWPKYEEMDPRAYQADVEHYPHRHHTRQQGAAFAMTDEMTDEFTTDDFDSEVDAFRHHAHREGHTHRYFNRPYRSHQHEVQHFSGQRHPPDQWDQPGHQQRPPELRYSQNEDLSERWLSERWQGLGGRDGGSRWDETAKARHRGHHTHHYDKNHDKVLSQWTSHDHHNDRRDHYQKGQRPIDRFREHMDHQADPSYQHHHTEERSKQHDLDRPSGRHHERGPSISIYDTIGTSESQEAYIQENHPSSTVKEWAGGYHENWSEESSVAGQETSSPEDAYFEKHKLGQSQASHPGLASSHTETQIPGPKPDQIHTQTAQQMPRQVTAQQTSTHQQELHSPTATHTPQQAPEQAPTETTARTYIERWNGEAERAAALEQARQALQPKEGERLVRVLYDFKPATRDEMALKQSEYLVQIGNHLSNGWAYGRKTGARGHFPASYVQ